VHAGDTIGHDRIIETLGTGGIGEVYAEDTKLHRRVALKVLPGVDLHRHPRQHPRPVSERRWPGQAADEPGSGGRR